MAGLDNGGRASSCLLAIRVEEGERRGGKRGIPATQIVRLAEAQ